MASLDTRSPDTPEPPEPDGDEYSPAFAAWAMMITFVLLTVLVVGLWALKEL